MGVQSSGMIILNNGDLTSPMPTDIKVTGTNSFSGNYGDGLEFSTLGNVSLSNVTASDATVGFGIEGQLQTEGKVFTMTGNNYLNSNYANGIYLLTLGDIKVNNLNANFNGDLAGFYQTGAHLANSASTSSRVVVMTGTNVFIGNQANGLFIAAKGNVTLNNVRAHLNGPAGSGSGAFVNSGGGTGTITFTGVNSFRNNDDHGLRIVSNGAVVINKITAESNNDFDGLIVEPTASAITLMCGTFTDNGENGYDVTTSGQLKLVGVLSIGNVGANVDESFGSKVVVRNCP
jgi:hypothetical protein